MSPLSPEGCFNMRSPGPAVAFSRVQIFQFFQQNVQHNNTNKNVCGVSIHFMVSSYYQSIHESFGYISRQMAWSDVSKLKDINKFTTETGNSG